MSVDEATDAIERELIEAIGNKNAVDTATRLIEQSPGDSSLAQAVLDTCRGIAAGLDEERARLNGLPALQRIAFTPAPSQQLHHLTAHVGSHDDASRTITALRDAGYVSWHAVRGGAEAALLRSVDRVSLAHLGGLPFVVELTWPPGPFSRLPSPLQPIEADVAVVELPAVAWPLYGLVRPGRLVSERVGLRKPRSRHLGPILSTPPGLLEPLFAFAGLGPDDHLVDLGCGEGRILRAAATTIGCRVSGVEADARLVARAEQVVRAEIDAGTAKVAHGDAATFELGDATVVFLFIPSTAVGDVVAQIRGRGFRGRIVAHEQEPLPAGASPTRSKVLATGQALTVAHLWDGTDG